MKIGWHLEEDKEGILNADISGKLDENSRKMPKIGALHFIIFISTRPKSYIKNTENCLIKLLYDCLLLSFGMYYRTSKNSVQTATQSTEQMLSTVE